MATCSNCLGAGGSYGNYQSCYSCGGSGSGGFTNVACMACGGSGRSSQREWNTCWTCGAMGTVADPPKAFTSAPARPRKGARAAASTRAVGAARQSKPFVWTKANKAAFVIGYVASAGALYASGMESWPPLLLALIGGLLVARLWQPLLVLGVIGGAIWMLDRGGF